tara:strand:- start:708 stop:911 length:204 start_codon:yes stop_codon:yes gene_type:complete
MSSPNPQEEITKLEEELKTIQENRNQAIQIANNCEVRIIQVQKEIETHKKYLPEEAVTTVPTGFTKN